MAFTTKNDINVLQSSDTSVIGAGAGNDTYILTPHTLAGNEVITISDTGSNSLQLIAGLEIQSFLLSSTALRLVLNNGAQITVTGANNFTFEPGGNIVSGIDNPDLSFADFATQVLGVAVPATGTVTGGPIVIGATAPSTVTLAVGTIAPVAADPAEAEIFTLQLDGAAGAYAATDNTQIDLSGFVTTGDSADALRFDLPTGVGAGLTTLDQLNGVFVDATRTIAVQDNFGDTLINFGADANNDVVSLNLVGIADPSVVAISVI